MTAALSLEALSKDEALRREEFPVCAHQVYLAHAAVCPLPGRVVAALRRYLERAGQRGQFEHLHADAEAGARALAAQLLGATSEEIAFVSSTSAGIGMVATGLRWAPGDGVLYVKGDFPSNVYPWRQLERWGVRVTALTPRVDGTVGVAEVAAALDDRTRLVSLSSIHFATGGWTDVDAVGALLRDRGVLFCVDAIQSFGAVPLSARNVDFLTADAHKWMLGPQGTGILFVRRERFEDLSPALVGWKSVAASKDFFTQRFQLAGDARRYEPGSLNALGIIGIHAALGLLAEVGVDVIARRLHTIRARLLPALATKGYLLVGAPSLDHPSGITSFRRRTDGETMAFYQRLDARGIVTSLRYDPLGNRCLRVAPHFYTSDAEIDVLLDNL